LKGILTEKIEHLNEKFDFLKNKVTELRKNLNIKDNKTLSELALKFCLSINTIDSVLVGINNIDELSFAIETEKNAGLPENIMSILLDSGIDDKFWLNPANWPKE
jgi:aryl-alcohol dehydrogenase-like predicted oxidoreductase